MAAPEVPRILWAGVLCASLLGTALACASQPGDRPAKPEESSTPQDTETALEEAEAGKGGDPELDADTARTGDPELEALAQQARADLAEHLSVAPEEIEIRRAEWVTWRDGSVGCPRPGMVYAQMLTEGARLLLAADGRTYHYHQAGRGAPFLCESPSPIEPLPAYEDS